MDSKIKRIMERTGLTEEKAKIYWYFCKHADFSGESGIILPRDVEYELGRLLDEEKITPKEGRTLKDSYDFWLNVFRDNGLIADDEVRCNDFSYPVLIGYQPLNDPELYAAYRKNGEERWSGRMSVEFMDTEGKQMSQDGYEFREP